MAISQANNQSIFGGANLVFRAIFRFERRLEEYRLYRKTVRELSRLSDRELADLNLSRHDIARVAREAVDAR